MRLGPVRRRSALRRGVIAAGAGGLAACGLPQGTGGGAGHGTTPATVTMWHIWDGNRTAPFQKALDTLSEQRPHLRVDPTVFNTSAETEQKIVAAVAAGTPPDVLMNNQNIFVDLAGSGAFVALDERLKAARLSAGEWYEGAYQSSVWHGKLYGFPAVNSGPRLLYYNKSILGEAGLDPGRPPQTWLELQRASQQVTRLEGDSFARTGWNPASGTFEYLIFGNNGRVFTPDARRIAGGGPEGLQTIEYLTDFSWSVYGGPAKLAEWLRANGGTFAQDPFIAGKVALKVDGPFIIPQIKEFGPQLDYGVAAVPHGPQGRFADPMWVNWMYSLPTATRQADAAWEVARWVGHGEGHRTFMLDQQRPGVIKKYNDDPQYPRINPHWKTINEILDRHTVADQVVPGRGRAIAALNTHLTRVHARDVNARDGLAQGVREAQQELDQAWSRVGAPK
ncbi:MAG TPA: extracellular solute-binding protein [Chloroflexota bacterium]|jgi:multiple sugar transport system substrate-binding protein|nr:extracellular solute-binding protein [Chloroflexota bacterium]